MLRCICAVPEGRAEKEQVDQQFDSPLSIPRDSLKANPFSKNIPRMTLAEARMACSVRLLRFEEFFE